jgi:ferritin-like metal-binding protein YciE
MPGAQHESLIMQVARIEHYPEVARRLEQHISETEGQIACSTNCSTSSAPTAQD